MKPRAATNRKIELRFMDCAVKIEGKKNLEMKALSIMAALVQDRMRMYELMQELEAEEHNKPINNRKLKPDIMYV